MSLAPHSLTTNGRVTPLGVEDPEFAWTVPDTRAQDEWQIEVSRSEEFAGDVHWTSDWTQSDMPFGVRYDGTSLASKATYYWRVRLRLDDGSETPWSSPSSFDTGIGVDGIGPARWITSDSRDARARRVLYFREEASVSSPVVRARAYVSALGWYRLFVNGHDLTGHSLVPRWTPYDKYVEYQVYDITREVSVGTNVIGITVADGRFRGALGMSAKGATYGDDIAAIALIELQHADGSSTVWASDERWTVGHGRITTSDPKFGERADLRIDDEAWKSVHGTAPDHVPASLLPDHSRALVAEEVEPVTSVEERAAVVLVGPNGSQIFDLGQNFAGIVRISLPAGDGTTARILYSEVLTPDGGLDLNYLSAGPARGSDKWFQRDEVVLGPAPTDYTPSFTIHGFRYVSVEGLPAELEAGAVIGIVLSSDLPEISHFAASDPRLERLWENVLWGLRSNFVDTPTDCPTRERSGWTGDIQVFAPTAIQLVDAQNYLRRYLVNVEAEQYEDGRVPPMIPTEDSVGRKTNPVRFSSTSVGWGDVTVMTPWDLYLYYGDEEVLRRQYSSAKRWVDQLATRAARKPNLRRRISGAKGPLEKYIVDTGYHWGEWLRPGEGFSEVLGNLVTHRPVVASAYFAHSSRLLSQIAGVIGAEADRTRYADLATNASEAWRAAFVSDGGSRIGDDKQDDYVRALSFELLKPEQRGPAAGRLVELIEAAGFHLGTGFLSTPMLLPELVKAGYEEVAYKILFQDTAPSWLAQVKEGATTIWENWVGYKPNGHAKGSHNHYAFGSVAQFLQENIGGIAPLRPGYQRFSVAPGVKSGLDYAATSIKTRYGLASASWRRTGTKVDLEVLVPAGTVAEVRVGVDHLELQAGEHSLTFIVE